MTGPRIVGDLSELPESGFGARTLMWWGILGFILIEGGGFALAAGSYFFLMNHTRPWPPHFARPDLGAALAFLAVILLSEIPNVFTRRAALAKRERPMQAGLIVMILVGAALLALRWFELRALNTRWDESAYGSIVWALMFLHTVHLLTDWADTVVVTAFTFTHEVDGDRFSDVADNALYWHFVVLSWLPIHAIVFWVPRWVN